MSVRDAGQMPTAEKQLLERLLGEPIEPGEKVLVLKVPESRVPDETTRQAALARLRSIMDESHRRAVEAGITAEESDAAIEEAIDFVRGRRW